MSSAAGFLTAARRLARCRRLLSDGRRRRAAGRRAYRASPMKFLQPHESRPARVSSMAIADPSAMGCARIDLMDELT